MSVFRWIFLIGTLMIAVSWAPLGARADSIGVRLAPAQIALSVPAGSMHEERIQVTNTTDSSESFSVSLSDYSSVTTGNIAFQALGSQPDSAAAFTTISPTRIDIQPHETVVVVLRVAPGQQQTAGRYRTAVAVGPEPPVQIATTDGAMVGVSGKVASLIGVTVLSGRPAAGQYQALADRYWPWGAGIAALIIAGISLLVYRHRRTSPLLGVLIVLGVGVALGVVRGTANAASVTIDAVVPAAPAGSAVGVPPVNGSSSTASGSDTTQNVMTTPESSTTITPTHPSQKSGEAQQTPNVTDAASVSSGVSAVRYWIWIAAASAAVMLIVLVIFLRQRGWFAILKRKRSDGS